VNRIVSLLLCFLGVGILAAPRAAIAHETPIAVLELRETQPGQFIIHWIFDSSRGLVPPTATYPEHCKVEPPQLICGDKGLVGTLTVNELGAKYTGAVIRITRRDGTGQSFALTGSNPSVRFVANPGSSFAAKLDIAKAYVQIGIEHILLGVDHLLFVLGLIWIVRSRWMLIKTITSFTVAHSITLAAATLGIVGVPVGAVNAAIALSIVFIGVEIVKLHRGQIGLTARRPWIVAFAFGLLHGFGFATALTELGLPRGDLPLALLSFNVGVEIGQVAFVLVALALMWSFRVLEVRWPTWSRDVPAYVIGSFASFWFISRTLMIIAR
jgi:HupE / UreJ protein.